MVASIEAAALATRSPMVSPGKLSISIPANQFDAPTPWVVRLPDSPPGRSLYTVVSQSRTWLLRNSFRWVQRRNSAREIAYRWCHRTERRCGEWGSLSWK